MLRKRRKNLERPQGFEPQLCCFTRCAAALNAHGALPAAPLPYTLRSSFTRPKDIYTYESIPSFSLNPYICNLNF
jgi:hypothetical protein